MINIQEGFYDLVVKCTKYCGDSHIVDKKKTTDEDIWNSAVFVVLLRLGGRLDEAQSNYLLGVIKKDDKLLDKDYLLNTSFGEWSKRLLNIIKTQKEVETNPTKLSALGVIRESTSEEAPIRQLHDTLYNFLDYIMEKQINKGHINNFDPSKSGDLIADIMKMVAGIGFTKATIFSYEIGLAYDFSAVSEHVKMFVDRWEDPYVINHMLRSEILEDYQARNSNILMRHLDLAIYALYTGRAQLFRKRNKSKVTPRMILEWIDLRRFGIDRFLKIIGDLDLIEQYSQEFTEFIDARL